MSRKQSWVQGLGNALAMATNMAAAIALGLFVGKYLDGKLNTGYWLTLLGVIIGVATGLKIMYDHVMEEASKPFSLRDDEDEEQIKPRPSQETIESLKTARLGLKEVEAEVKKIYVRDEDETSEKEIPSSEEETGQQKEDGSA